MNSSAKKDPWHWDKSTVIKEGADALLLLLERMASMSWCWGDGVPTELSGWFAHQRPSESILSSLWGTGPQQHVALPELWETRAALWHGWICALAPAHTFLGKVEITLNINSPANCKTNGEDCKVWGHSRERPSLKPQSHPRLAATWPNRASLQSICSQVCVFQLILHLQKCWEVTPWCSGREMTTHQNEVIRLVSGFLLFSSVQSWVNKWLIHTCECASPLLPPPSAGETLLGSWKPPEYQKNALFCGFLDKPLTVTPLWHAGLHGWLHTENKSKSQHDRDCVTAQRYRTSWDWLRTWQYFKYTES